MDSTAACAIVNQLIFRPGWHFEAWPLDRYTISVQCRIETVDTDYPPYYTIPTTTGMPIVRIGVLDKDEDELLCAIKTRIIEYVNDHEDREFLRRGDLPGMPAPFHPHTPSKELRWRRAQLAESSGGR